ncbi:aldose 1-epimerase-like [Canna indica]|uniref:Aldose 1-epimerase n=1 Tax=Canna indica TaxID=4628 RepID=A0AAQ3JQ92_9LILI|nr:aldose 1-epimerase-like [Canna indica]
MAKALLLLCLSLLSLSSLSTSNAAARKTVGFYELKKGDFSLKVTNWGATVVSVILPDSKGKLSDIVLGYDGLRQYIANPPNFGAVVGRVANRISGGRFVLNGKVYRLYKNDGNNTLHGGHRGFAHVIWTVKEKVDGEYPYITLYYASFDGEQGFPGAVDVYVTYKISGPYQLSVIMSAKALNKATPVNLAQHTYWNLGGHTSGTILSNTVQIYASKITPVDTHLIPTGEFAPVYGTPYDFLKPTTVGSRIKQLAGGYDINYVLDLPLGNDGMRKVAVVENSVSGRKLELWANQPGVQFYTANTLNETNGKDGHAYGSYAGLCLETQGFPDAVNHPNFPSQIVNPGQEYKHNMLFKFSF